MCNAHKTPIISMTITHDTLIIQNANKTSSQSHYLKRLHEAALQGVVDDLVKEKEDGWKSRTVQDSYTAELHCLE